MTPLKAYARPSSVNATNSYLNVYKGWREFSGGKRYFLKSLWEINYAHYLEWLKKKAHIQDWWYEEDEFWFDKIKRGVRSYKPDFKVLERNGKIRYYEVKGYMDKKSATKIKRVEKYYKGLTLIVVDGEDFKELNKFGRLIGFETNSS